MKCNKCGEEIAKLQDFIIDPPGRYIFCKLCFEIMAKEAATGAKPKSILNCTGRNWKMIEEKAFISLNSGRPNSVIGLIIRDEDTGQTTIIDQGKVITLHPSQWHEVMNRKTS